MQEVKSELEGALNTYDQILVEGLSLVEMPIHKQNAQKAIDNRIIDLVDDVGGFEPIANETSFPNANPNL